MFWLIEYSKSDAVLVLTLDFQKTGSFFLESSYYAVRKLREPHEEAHMEKNWDHQQLQLSQQQLTSPVSEAILKVDLPDQSYAWWILLK